MVTSGDWQVIWSGLSAGSELSSVQLLSCVWLCDARLSCPSPTPGACSNSCPLSQLMPSISSSVVPFSAFNLSQHQGLFQWVSSHQVARVLEFQLQHQSFQLIFRSYFLKNWLIESPCSPRDSQESYPALQFKSINSSVLSFLYCPTLTSIHDYWKNHSLDYGWTFLGKVTSLLFNMLPRLVIAFLQDMLKKL